MSSDAEMCGEATVCRSLQRTSLHYFIPQTLLGTKGKSHALFRNFSSHQLQCHQLRSLTQMLKSFISLKKKKQKLDILMALYKCSDSNYPPLLHSLSPTFMAHMAFYKNPGFVFSLIRNVQ